jgi:hypothetical protein
MPLRPGRRAAAATSRDPAALTDRTSRRGVAGDRRALAWERILSPPFIVARLWDALHDRADRLAKREADPERSFDARGN